MSPSQGRYLHTDIHALNGILTHDPSVGAGEDTVIGFAAPQKYKL
jgi:hypothetical protein